MKTQRKSLTIENTYGDDVVDLEVVEFDEFIKRLSGEQYKALCEYAEGEDKVTEEILAHWYQWRFHGNHRCWVNEENKND